jgi:crotonobetaine/carnitine-CoA ligase
MSRAKTLSQPGPSLEERRRRIESEPLPSNIAALIDEAADAAGDRMAWNFFESGETITYADLRRRVHGLARGLAAIGVKKGTHVAVMLPNVAAFPLTWLAIGTLGAVMIPVNVGYQPRELRFVLDSGDAEYAVVDEACWPMLEGCIAEGGLRVARRNVVVRGKGAAGLHDWDALAQPSDEAYVPPTPVELDDLLNIQFTSGTTGFPKGCMLTQRYWLTSGKVNAFRDGRRYERILASTPFYYMDPQWLLLMTFYQRGTLFVATRQSTSRFTSWLREHRVQFCLFPFLVYKNPPSSDDPLDDLIRGNVYGVAPGVHAKIEERFDFCAREAFGMTELGSAMFMPIEATDMVARGRAASPFRFASAGSSTRTTRPCTRRGRRAVRARPRASCSATTTTPKRPRRRCAAAGSTPATCSARTSAATSTSSAGRRT